MTTYSKKRALALVLLFLTSMQAYAELKTMRFPTAADGEVEILFDTETKLPVSASDERARVSIASLSFLPKKPGDPLYWTWRYGLDFKAGVKVTSVTIEDERDAELKSILHEANPLVSAEGWRGQEAPREATMPFFDALMSKDVWILLRRITVTYEDGANSKLHQLIVMPPVARRRMADEIMRAAKAP